jgi:hypothetical protein
MHWQKNQNVNIHNTKFSIPNTKTPPSFTLKTVAERSSETSANRCEITTRLITADDIRLIIQLPIFFSKRISQSVCAVNGATVRGRHGGEWSKAGLWKRRGDIGSTSNNHT